MTTGWGLSAPVGLGAAVIVQERAGFVPGLATFNPDPLVVVACRHPAYRHRFVGLPVYPLAAHGGDLIQVGNVAGVVGGCDLCFGHFEILELDRCLAVFVFRSVNNI